MPDSADEGPAPFDEPLRDPPMDFLLPVPAVFAVLACHWMGLFIIRVSFTASLGRLGPRSAWGQDLSLGIVILMLVAWLFVDVAVAAAILMLTDGDLSYGRAFLFAIACFTTLGATAPDRTDFWALAGPLIAMCGIFIFGWTTSFLIDCTHAIREVRHASGRPERAKH